MQIQENIYRILWGLIDGNDKNKTVRFHDLSYSLVSFSNILEISELCTDRRNLILLESMVAGNQCEFFK